MKPLLRVAVTGSAGQIAYSLLFRLASGEAFGFDVPLALHLLELPEAEQTLKGVEMELKDAAFPLLKEIHVGSDPKILFRDIDWAILVGAKPRTLGMERGDLLKENGKIFIGQGQALDQVAKKSVKVLVVGNPCNTNALIAAHHAPSLPCNHFFAMTRLDQNRASSLLASKASLPVDGVKNVIIWGNHSSTQVPDAYHATLAGQPALAVIQDEAWLQNTFVSAVQKRGAEVIALRGKSSAASAASAVIDQIRALITPTPMGEWYSLGVYSKGNPYGIDEDLIFSFPCRTTIKGEVEIVPALPLNSWLREKIDLSQKELLEEREVKS